LKRIPGKGKEKKGGKEKGNRKKRTANVAWHSVPLRRSFDSLESAGFVGRREKEEKGPFELNASAKV